MSSAPILTPEVASLPSEPEAVPRQVPLDWSSWIGAGVLVSLGLLSLWASSWGRPLLTEHCFLGPDVVRGEESVCALTLGGLWVSLGIGLAGAALSCAIALVGALACRLIGGAAEQTFLRGVDALFSLPDVLLLMVLQLAAQSISDFHPQLRLPPAILLVLSLSLVSFAAPLRMLRDRMAHLEAQEFVAAARALGASRWRSFALHLWPSLRSLWGALFVSRLPYVVLAESTVSFFGIARLEPMSLGRYLGTRYGALVYEGGARVVGPAWLLLMLVVWGTAMAARRVRKA